MIEQQLHKPNLEFSDRDFLEQEIRHFRASSRNKNGIRFKIFQQCIANQNEAHRKIYKENNIDHEIFNFTRN